MQIKNLNKNELIEIIKSPPVNLLEIADSVRQQNFGKKVLIRGLIEITNYCKNDCFYCGIRKSNYSQTRYRMSRQDILASCETGYKLGIRTFVLQGGEDPFFSDAMLCEIIKEIKSKYPECAVTLSLGEKDKQSYKALKDAGADRYLLRHETATKSHYNKLHPSALSLKNRKNCLAVLKSLGFQTGAGFMVGSPYQTANHLAADLLFMKRLKPAMVGIGPFVPHIDTPFGRYPHGELAQTMTMIALTRILLPSAYLPATTALSAIAKDGMIHGLRAGANVVMPNLTPLKFREKYMLYNNKPVGNDDVYENFANLKCKLENAGFELDMSR